MAKVENRGLSMQERIQVDARSGSGDETFFNGFELLRLEKCS